MRLIELKPRLSLEFTPAERNVVWRRLRKFGRPTYERFASADRISVAGEQFVLMDDWGEYALISLSEAGDTILRAAVTQRSRRPARDYRIIGRQLRGYGGAIERLTRQAA